MAALTQLLDKKSEPINQKLQKFNTIENSVGFVVGEKVPEQDITKLSKELAQV